MPDDRSPSAGDAGVLAHLRELLGRVDVAGRSLQALQRQTRRQLVEWAEVLGLTGLQRLTKDAVVERLREALASLGLPVKNLFDNHHFEIPGGARLGRVASLTVSTTW